MYKAKKLPVNTNGIHSQDRSADGGEDSIRIVGKARHVGLTSGYHVERRSVATSMSDLIK